MKLIEPGFRTSIFIDCKKENYDVTRTTKNVDKLGRDRQFIKVS